MTMHDHPPTPPPTFLGTHTGTTQPRFRPPPAVFGLIRLHGHACLAQSAGFGHSGDMARPAYRGVQWRRVRAYVLARDRWQCQIQVEGICAGVATEVDHLDPVAFHGPSADAARLRAACRPCNNHLGGKVAQLKARIANSAAVVGPSRQW